MSKKDLREEIHKPETWIQAIAIILTIAGCAVWMMRQQKKPLGPEDLKINVAELRSQASEGRLIAEQLIAGKVTSAYLQTETLLLRDETEQAIETLSTYRLESGVEATASQAVEYARQLSADLSSLSYAFNNLQEAERIKQHLETTFASLFEIE